MGLGALVDFNLAEARERAKAARQLLADGIDPLDHRQAERARKALAAAKDVTFKQCAAQYYDAHADGWTSARHRQQFTSSMRDYVYPIIGSTSVAAIDEPLVLKILAAIWKDKTVTARRVRNRIAAVLDYAAACKYRTGSNPARWEGHLEHLLPAPEKIAKIAHHAALAHGELAAFIAELRHVEGVPARALEFLILTATRSNETVEAVWSEISFEEQTWTIPAARMKAAREHRVPLSDRALEILRALPHDPNSQFIFIGPTASGTIGGHAMYRLLRQLRPGVTVHGLRSTFRDWAGELTNFPHDVCEAALAHIKGKVERAYARGDLFLKRRKLMDAWARYCGTPKTEAPASVVTIGQRSHV